MDNQILTQYYDLADKQAVEVITILQKRAKEELTYSSSSNMLDHLSDKHSSEASQLTLRLSKEYNHHPDWFKSITSR